MEALESIFDADEIALRQQIPLDRRQTKDAWIWVFEKKGVYTVRSGYKLQYDAF